MVGTWRVTVTSKLPQQVGCENQEGEERGICSSALKELLKIVNEQWQVADVWQTGDDPALPGVKEPVLAACRCGAGRRLSWRITCWRGAGRSLTWRVACQRGNVGRSLILRVACWSGVERLSTRSTSPSTQACVAGTDSRVFAPWRGRSVAKSCMTGTDSRVYALCRPRFRSKKQVQLVEVPEIEQRTFEQGQVVNGLAGGQDRAQQTFC